MVVDHKYVMLFIEAIRKLSEREQSFNAAVRSGEHGAGAEGPAYGTVHTSAVGAPARAIGAASEHVATTLS